MEHWQSDKTSLLSRTAFIFNNELLSDVRFIVGSTNTEYPAHKLLLSLASPVFEQRFSQHESENVIRVPDIVPSAFHKMLQYIYTDMFDLESLMDAYNVLMTAEKFKIEHLQTMCQNYISKRNIAADNACRMYDIASELKMSRVMEFCQYTFVKDTNAVLKSHGFLQAKLSTVEALLQNETLSAEEFSVLEAAMKWGSAECRRRKIPQTGANIRKCIDPVIHHLRFLTLSVEEFHNFLSKYDNVLTTSEVFTITMKLSKPSENFPFPPAVCPSLCKRVKMPTLHSSPKKLNHLTQGKNPSATEELEMKILENVKSSMSCQPKLKNPDLQPKLRNPDLQPKLKNPSLQPKLKIPDLQPKLKISDLQQRLTNSDLQQKSINSNSHNFAIKEKIKQVKPLNNVKNDLAQSLISFIEQDSAESSSEAELNFEEYVKISKQNGPESSCRACEIHLETESEIPNGMKIVDVSSVVAIKMDSGKINVIGLNIQLKNSPVSAEDCVPIIVRITKGKKSYEAVYNKEFSDEMNILFEQPLHMEPEDSASISVIIESVQLQQCYVRTIRDFTLIDRDINFNVLLSGNQKVYKNKLPFFISHVLYQRC